MVRSVVYPLTLQLVATLGALGFLAMAPPAEGLQLLVPIGARAQARMLPIAIGHGARLVGAGPLPGSFVVRGAWTALGLPLAAAGILTLAAPDEGCEPPGAPDADR